MQRKVMSIVLCALMFATVFVIEVPKDVSAQVTEEWVARYDGPGNGPANDWDRGEAVAIDTFGNVPHASGEKRLILSKDGNQKSETRNYHTPKRYLPYIRAYRFHRRPRIYGNALQ